MRDTGNLLFICATSVLFRVKGYLRCRVCLSMVKKSFPIVTSNIGRGIFFLTKVGGAVLIKV
jgi:hypothetical protein